MSRRMRDLAAITLALVLGGFATLFLSSCGGSGSETIRGSTSSFHAQYEQRAVPAAQHFLDRYVLPDGRVERIDQGGDTVGEGQAYGMLLAAGIG
ncbi:MAG: hypothetical protein JO244_00690, partial [Solirubrobacterales bacterium]|nr:hypothetical protein [Solirubrobacterales bacterium]